MEEGINSMVMKLMEDTKLECTPIEIIKMDTFETQAENNTMRQEK